MSRFEPGDNRPVRRTASGVLLVPFILLACLAVPGVAFAGVFAAALIRVAGPLWAPEHLVGLLWGSSLAWAAAFAVYVVVYAPILVSPRADGRPG